MVFDSMPLYLKLVKKDLIIVPLENLLTALQQDVNEYSISTSYEYSSKSAVFLGEKEDPPFLCKKKNKL
jgi:hypothetical protein